MSFAGCFDNGMSSVRNVCVYRLGYWMEPISWRFTKLNFVWTTYFRLCRWLLRVCTLIYYLFILLGSFFSLLLSVLCVFFSLFSSSGLLSSKTLTTAKLYIYMKYPVDNIIANGLKIYQRDVIAAISKQSNRRHWTILWVISRIQYMILSFFRIFSWYSVIWMSHRLNKVLPIFFLSLVLVSIDALTFRLG